MNITEFHGADLHSVHLGVACVKNIGTHIVNLAGGGLMFMRQ